ncbi:Scr1 family TA system antitoxin-like transcriptional regulator [Pseudonocardia sp. Ae717_Ps2]|uniref:Scr1 family TA system antitoxin-like transcriptional regulator n=1 Tax=Pseudonocardia sp. Ae717_Ps2 TaxID=1885573 RepID=UPI0009F9D0DE|nr:Scr1 family TA system antitoxin-like transcriptional regulator [Pseudonocardia sp. Ae717_Ps2]
MRRRQRGVKRQVPAPAVTARPTTKEAARLTGDRADVQRHLGEILQKLRLSANLSGRSLAAILGCDQSRISRIESGQTKISDPEAQRWARETGASTEDRAEISALVCKAAPLQISWRGAPIGGWGARQGDLSALESEAQRILVWHRSGIPDLLQSSSYMLQGVQIESQYSKQSTAARMFAKVSRQRVIYEQSSRLEVILTERALRGLSGNQRVLVDQLIWIGSLAKQDRLTLDVYPIGGPLSINDAPSVAIHLAPQSGMEDVVVHTELKESPESGPESTQRHIDRFRAYQRHSWRGDQAVEFVESLAREMSRGESGDTGGDGGHDGA